MFVLLLTAEVAVDSCRPLCEEHIPWSTVSAAQHSGGGSTAFGAWPSQQRGQE